MTSLPPHLAWLAANPEIFAVIFVLLVLYFLYLTITIKRREYLARHNPKPTMPGFPSPSLLDDEGHRRMDPPINLKALDAAVERGE